MKRSLRALAVAGTAVALLSACGSGGALDTRETQMTENGLFRVTFTSDLEPIAINTIHTWTVTVVTPDGEPVTDAQIVVDGTMPEHEHGLPTIPEVTRHLGNGAYLVEGMKFNMTGFWEMKVYLVVGDRQDDATFNLMLE